MSEPVELLAAPGPPVSVDAARRAGHSVDLDAITHRFGAVTAVDDVRLNIGAGELVALLGPSGCGKTTLLRIIGGFVTPSAGSVRVDGRAIDHLPASRREIGIVFQNYALFPHMTVYENVAYGLRARRAPREVVRERVATMLGVVQLDTLRARMPRELSGGQQQRVALARALAVEPRILLLDEPFGALDKNLRLDMQIELKRLQRQFGITAILVTHDQEEAMSLADRIAVMHRGRVEQFATPVEVYDRPRTLFVNSFVGTANLLAGEVVARHGGTLTVRLDAGGIAQVPAPAVLDGTRVVVSARPENLRLHAEAAPDRWPVEVRMRMPVGAQTVSEVVTRTGQSLKVTEPRDAGAPAGEAGGPRSCGIVSTSAVSTFAAPAPEPAHS